MSLIPQILTFVGMGRMPSDSEFYLGLSVVASVFLGSIFKGLNTNSNGTPFKKNNESANSKDFGYSVPCDGINYLFWVQVHY